MRKWKIGLFLIGLICLIILVSFYPAEGFQIQTMNMSYPLKELYLYAPNIKGKSDYVDPYDDIYAGSGAGPGILTTTSINQYSSAYSLEEARAKCKEMGATLATLDQLKLGTALGAMWCAAGWVDDGNMYAPVQNICPNTAKHLEETIIINNKRPTAYSTGKPAKLVKITTNRPAKAFPVCWGVKPPEPTVSVQQFSRISYNMLNSELISSVMNPATNDLYPGTFTADEAAYALEKTNYNIGAVIGQNPARKYLIDRIATSGSTNPDTQIYKMDAGYAEDIELSSADACSILAKTRRGYVEEKFNKLRQVFSDVSGAVIDMLGAKNENAKFSAKLQDICSKETPESSPACMTLATLDFTLLYSVTGPTTNLLTQTLGSGAGSGAGSVNSEFNVVDSSTSRLAALEALNIFKFKREGELCQAYQRIQEMEGYIGCSPLSRNTMGSQCAYVNVGSTPVLEMIGLDVNAEEFLKRRLQEISPYFTTSNYAKVVSKILNQLSLTIRLPSLNDFNTSTQNFKETTDRVSAVNSYFSNS